MKYGKAVRHLRKEARRLQAEGNAAAADQARRVIAEMRQLRGMKGRGAPR
jgi:hypothetical protein